MKINLGPYRKNSDSRKIKVEIENFDTWSLDHTLAYIILPALLQLRASKMGVPAEFADIGGGNYTSQTCFDFYEETHNEAFDIAVKRWEETLDKMIWSFQQILIDDWENQYHHGKAEYDWVPSNDQYLNPSTGQMEDTFTMIDKNPEDHWTDYEGMREHERRIQEGLELFGKYYQHLWD
jgi:hypothetical protein